MRLFAIGNYFYYCSIFDLSSIPSRFGDPACYPASMDNPTERQKILSETHPEIIEEARQRLQKQGADFKALDAKQDRRSQALSSFPFFLESYFSHYFTIPSGPQQQELIQLIESLKNRSKRKVKKYSRAVSRGFGKSTIITLCGVLWLLLRGDWKFVILISASMPHAEGFLRKISDETEGNEILLEDFPELEAGRDANSTTIAWNDRHLVFTGGFAVLAKGFGNKIRGLRYKNYRPDAIVIDDPDEYSDVESQTIMQRRYRWLERSALKTGSVLAGLDVIIVYTTIAKNGTFLFVLLLAMIFASFSHCNNAEHEEGSLLPPRPTTAPAPPPLRLPSLGPAIYLWPSVGCPVNGAMQSCGNTLTGVAGGNAVCQNAFEDYVFPEFQERTLADLGGTIQHRAFLATAAEHPRDFALDASLPIRRPDRDGTLIANNWAELFTSGAMLAPISETMGVNIDVYIGLDVNYMLATNNCNDWVSAASSDTGATLVLNTNAVVASYPCNFFSTILCITY